MDFSLDYTPLQESSRQEIRHFYHDPDTGKALIPETTQMIVGIKETVADKLRGVIITRKYNIRDYYDLWVAYRLGFDFYQDDFIRIFKQALLEYLYDRNLSHDFGLKPQHWQELGSQKDAMLTPFIRRDEEFDLADLRREFNKILAHHKYNRGWNDYYKFYMLRQLKIAKGKLRGMVNGL